LDKVQKSKCKCVESTNSTNKVESDAENKRLEIHFTNEDSNESDDE
jgi:hypothetical protein